jgi:hypothetical protein
LAPLPRTSRQASSRIDVIEVDRDQFRQAQAAGIEELDHGPVAQGQGVIGLGLVEEGAELVGLEGGGQFALGLGGADALGGVGAQAALPQQVFEEAAQGREFALQGLAAGAAAMPPGDIAAHLLRGHGRPVQTRARPRAPGADPFQVAAVIAQGQGREPAFVGQVGQEGGQVAGRRVLVGGAGFRHP